ncbi:MAG: two-component regulator propeller domain-containing protein [Chryseolinea sp.]
MSSIYSLSIFLIIYLISTLQSAAQLPSFRFEVLTSKEGLPSNTVLSAARDKNGFMWFGTRLCPVRYDGSSFQSFSTPETNFVSGLAVDEKNNLWFATDRGGICTIDTRNLKMTSIPTDGKYGTGDFFIDSKGFGWYSDRYGVNRIDLKTNATKHYQFKQTNFIWNKASFVEDDSKQLWVVGRDNGLFRYDEKSDSLFCLWGQDAIDPSKRQIVMLNKATPAKDGILWIGSFELGLVKYDTRTNTYEAFGTDRVINEVRAIEEGVDDYGKRIFWVGDQYGLGIFRPDEKKFYYFKGILDEPYEVYDIYRDPLEGMVWVCTSKGIIKYHPNSNIFKTRALPKELLTQPVEANVMIEDNRPGYDSICYIGLSHTGMIKWDRSTDHFTLIKYPGATADTRWMVQRADGTFWIGTNRKDYESPGIFTYDPVNQIFITPELNVKANKYYSVPFFMYGAFDSQDRLWIGNSDEGIHVLNGNDGSEVTPWNDAVQHKLLENSNLITSLLIIEKGDAWIGTYNGIKIANEKKRTFDTFDTAILGKEITDLAVNSILKDKDGSIWASRWGSLTKMSPSGKLLETFTTKMGFNDRENRGLAQDIDGNIWMGNYEGLYCIKPGDRKIFRFTVNDGLLSNNTAGKVFIDRSGSLLWIGQTNGFNFINLKELLNSPQSPILAVSSFKVQDKVRHPDLTAPISLKRTDNSFSVNFIALNYRKHQDNQYAYFLEGFETEWHYSGSEHLAYYTNLNPGSYTLRIKAGDTFGNWNYGTMSLVINVQPAFYETWWFRTLAVVLVSSLLYGLYRYRINQLLRLQQMRNRISADLHDELGSSLSSISIIGMMAQNKLVDEHPSKPLLERIVEEVQQISGSLDDIVWNISPKNDALSSLIARMTRYASELFEAKQIAFEFTTPVHMDQVTLSMEQRRNFYLVFKESVNNLVKYSACKTAKVGISFEQKNLVLQISDDGKGFDPEALNEGDGLFNLKARADVLQGQITIQSEPGMGTIITLKFPLKLGDPKGLLTISGQ